jgi:hypothetical protein
MNFPVTNSAELEGKLEGGKMQARFRFAAAVVAILLAVSTVPALAQDTAKSKLEVHGFLTQAYATGSLVEGRFPNPDGSPAGPTFSEQAIGIPEDGTFDYRNMAIQFRYAMSDKDVMVMQLSSRSLGDSPITAAEDDIELDWAFYERKLADSTSIKVGRVQIPYGIFNEIRDVGTILPFFRPAYNIYQEGSFTSETVDGLNLSHSFAADSDWSVDADIYFGQWELAEVDQFSGESKVARAKDSYGLQLWLNTPVSGLRAGVAYQHREVFDGILRLPDDPSIYDDFLYSLDGSFDKWVFRSEFRTFSTEPDIIPILLATDFEVRIDAFYAQLGWHPTTALRFYGQFETTDIWQNASSFTTAHSLKQREDISVAVNYLFSANIVLKAEYHQVEETDQSFIPVFGPTPGPPKLQPIFAPLENGDYTIISLSASF